MTTEHDDDLALSKLAPVPPAREAKDHALRRARVAFAEAGEARGGGWSAALDGARRGLVPAVLVGVVGVYLTWAVSAANVAFGLR